MQSLLDTKLILSALLKLSLAACLGGLIGLERETHGQSAGFRTYILISLGACLIMMVSMHLEKIYHFLDAQSAVRIDPGRIASYALAGMGFLGAGAIISGKGSVRGLTTAAGMWMITGVGLAVGCGFYAPAILATLLSLFILYALRYTKPLFRRDIYTTIILVSEDIGGQFDRIQEVMAKYPLTQMQFVSFHRQKDRGLITFRLSLLSKENVEWRELTRDLTELPGIRRIALEEGKVP